MRLIKQKIDEISSQKCYLAPFILLAKLHLFRELKEKRIFFHDFMPRKIKRFFNFKSHGLFFWVEFKKKSQ